MTRRNYAPTTSLQKLLLLSSSLLLLAYAADRDNEPPRNTFLADSAWPMTHRNTYNQGSTSLPGPTAGDTLRHEFALLSGTPSISLLQGVDDQQLWFHGPLSTGVVRADETFSKVDSIEQPLTLNAFPGAYVLVDKDGIFYAFHENTLSSYVYENTAVHRRSSLRITQEMLRSPADHPVGLSMLYDGNLVFGTRYGNLHVVDRQFNLLDSISLVEAHIVEEISNNFAVDENHGIYVVTSAKMRRIQWDGVSLSVSWECMYNVGDTRAAGRLGMGSGTAPSLMGTKMDDDRFVVIADGSNLMNLVLFWRDEIPSDWLGLPGKDRRIAAEVPITFGNPQAKTSVTEQSVLVRGYSALVVNNDYGVSLPSWTPDVLNQLFVLVTNIPVFAPKGIEKFQWNPSTRTLDSVWSNDLSCPNGIPTMSEASDLVYCIGQRHTKWGVEAMSWVTGKSSFFESLGYRLRYNSAYSAMQILNDRQLVSGSVLGSLRLRVVEPVKEESNAGDGSSYWSSLKNLLGSLKKH